MRSRTLTRTLPIALLIVTTGIPIASAQDAAGGKTFKALFQELQTNSAGQTDSVRLRALFDLAWEYGMHEFPEWATYEGRREGNDRWTDMSAEAIERRRGDLRLPLGVMDALDRSKLSREDQINYDLFRKDYESMLESITYPGDYLPINQMGGVQQDIPQVIDVMPASKVSDYEDIIARLRGVPRVVEQNMDLMRKGLEKGVTPPRITMRDVPEQVMNVIPDDPMQSAVLAPFAKFPASIPVAEQERLRKAAVDAYTQSVVPSFRTLHDFLVKTYIPASRTSIGLGQIPQGKEWYAFRVRRTTTTDLAPEEIHQIGLREVKRIKGEMEKIIAQVGFKGDFKAFCDFLRTDPRFYYSDSAALIQGYRDICKRADPQLIKLFGKLPRMPYGILPVPSYAEKSQTTAYYSSGSEDAARPGYFYANTYDLKSRPKWEMEALALHEAVPGHHLQISIAKELKDLPRFRRDGGYTAYVEGWGLYAESLGEEMGFYQDPYSKFGQLTYEMWRAIRLVVDPGIHALGWSREQAIEFFKENSSKSEHDIIVEVDRYISWPGQAVAYKIGELKIKELRAYATKELGDKFDIREFHDEVLGHGAVPLDLLEANIREWVAAKKGSGQL